MVLNSILLFPSSYKILNPLLLIYSSLFIVCNSLEEVGVYNTFTVSSFRYPESKVKPNDLRYIRVDLPPWFSSMSIALESDVDLDTKSIAKLSKSTLPLICFRDGSPPLPDVSNTALNNLELRPLSNGSFEGIEDVEIAEQCFPMQRNITIKFTNEQISPGVWYLGLFNGIGPTRTQGKMIVRAPGLSFSANISVDGCTTSTMWGQFCNQTVNSLACSISNSQNVSDIQMSNSMVENVVSCGNLIKTSCHGDDKIKVYSLEVAGIAERLIIMATSVELNTSFLNSTGNYSESTLMCFARHGAMPSENRYDYSGDIRNDPLVIRSPKVGRWYLTIIPTNLSKEVGEFHNSKIQVCYSLESQVLECPVGKAGPNCTWERYILQTVIRKESSPFESYYMPVSEKVPLDSANFPIEPLLSNSSFDEKADATWTYFLVDIPQGAAGGNIHIRLTSDTKLTYEIYSRFGGLPSLDSWDYYYANRTSSSAGSTFFLLYNSSEEKIDFYIIYAKEGTWSFGLRHLNPTRTFNNQTVLSVSLERCPRRCSSHGDCKFALDASGLTSYSFCSCDRTHGGFDCSIEIVSRKGHIWQSVALIASNAAALFPAYWSLRQKAFAEWVLFTSSGVSSALYHACDVGTWCVLSFNVLQFMDFWLSFMAIVSTFIYISTVDESVKRTIQTAVSILTALLAVTNATRPSNVIIVLGIGVAGLLIAWLVELSTKLRSLSFSVGFNLNMLHRLQTVRVWIKNLIKTLKRRFRWGFVLAGATALTMAAISWELETSESYWIWHSAWHVTIYTSSFLFLSSKAIPVTPESEAARDVHYELTRQDSLSRT